MIGRESVFDFLDDTEPRSKCTRVKPRFGTIMGVAQRNRCTQKSREAGEARCQGLEGGSKQEQETDSVVPESHG